MSFNNGSKTYASVSVDEQGELHARYPDSKRSDRHRPRAIRTSILVLFLLLLAVCVGLIEVLLHKSSKPSAQSSHPKASPAHEQFEPTIKTSDDTQDPCEEVPALEEASTALYYARSSLCAQFNETFTTGVPLSPPEVSAFNQWQLQYEAEQPMWSTVVSSLREVLVSSCLPALNPTVSWHYTETIFAGCTQAVQEVAYDCSVDKSIYMTDDTITDRYTAPCAATKGAMLSLTTQDPEVTVGLDAINALLGMLLTTATLQNLARRTGPTASATATSTATDTFTSFLGAVDSSGRSTSAPAVTVHEPTTTATPGMTSWVTSSSSQRIAAAPTATPWPIANLTSSNVVVAEGAVTPVRYFFALYLATILAIAIKVLWEITFSSFKMVEPFARLADQSGAPAEGSLFSQYLSNSVSLDSMKDCLRGYVMPPATTAIYILVTVLASLAASSMTVRATANCKGQDGQFFRCAPAWVTDVPLIRSVEGLLLACIALAILVAVYSRIHKTGLSADPSSIASIASLTGQEALLNDFRALDPLISDFSLSAEFKDRRYRLGSWQDALGNHQYGITKVTDPVWPKQSVDSTASNRLMSAYLNDYSELSNSITTPEKEARSSSFIPPKWSSRILDLIQLLSTVGLLGLVVAYGFDFKPDSFNSFFNSETVAPHLVFVGVATIIDIQWKRLEREVRITEPYRRMAKGSQPPETTVLINLHGTCWSNFFSSLAKACRFKHMWFQTLVSFVTVLSDFNVIAIATMIYSDGQTWTLLLVSTYAAVSITSSLVLVMLITMFWWRRGVVSQMPRCPDTIGAVISYLCASRFVREMVLARGGEMSQKARDDMIVAAGWEFSFRWKAGLDGRERWCVDYDSKADHRLLYSDTIHA